MSAGMSATATIKMAPEQYSSFTVEELNRTASDPSVSSNSLTMTDEVVSESLRDTFANDFDDGSIGPGRISAMSVEDDGSSFILSQSFGGSTVTELSSVFSMSEDDFDKMASRHARFLFDEIDSMLYEHETNGPPYLVKECHEWRAEFPHLRVLGRQVIDRQEEGFHLYPAMNLVPNGMEDISGTTETKDLLVHGKNFDAMRLNMGVGSFALSHPEGAAPLEEVLEENGTMEEILAIDYKTGEDEYQKLGPNKQSNGRPPITPFNCVKDNIISALFNHVLKEVVPAAKPLLERLLANAGEKGMPEELPSGGPTDDLELSLLSSRCSEKNSRSSAFGTSVLSSVPEDTPLGGLLTIRSKTLLNRERTMGLLDGITENLQSQTTVPSIRLNPVMFGSGHLSERRSSLNRIKLSPLENTRLQSLVPPGEVDHVTNANLDGLRGHRFATLTSQPSSTPTPKLPPLQNQRTIMSATNVPNTNINRSMQQRSKLVDVAKRWRPGSTESARSDRPTLRPFYCHPVAKTHKLSRAPVECGRVLTKPASSQPVTKPQLELRERYRQKSNLETLNRSGPSTSWNDPNQVRAQSRKCVSDLVSMWVEQHKLSINIPGAQRLLNAQSDKERHVGFCDEVLQNFIGKTHTDDHIQKCDVESLKPVTKIRKDLVGIIPNTKLVGSAAVIDGYIQKPCSKINLNAPTETQKLGNLSRGSWMHELADSSRWSQKTKVGSFSSGRETLNNTELWLQDGRIRVGSTARSNNSVKDICGCKRLLCRLPSKLPRPCFVKKGSCGDVGNSGELPTASDAGTVSQNARKIGKAGNSAVMWFSGVTDGKAESDKTNGGFSNRVYSEFSDRAKSGFFDKPKLELSVNTNKRSFDKADDNKAGSGFLDKADSIVSHKAHGDLSDKPKHKFCLKTSNRCFGESNNKNACSTFFYKANYRSSEKATNKFHLKDRDFDKADDDKADSGFFDKAGIGFSDKTGCAFHDKAKYRDSDEADGDKADGGILENAGNKSIGNANVKLSDKTNKRLLSVNSIKSADKVNSRVIYKASSRLTNESFDKAAGLFRGSRFSDKAATRSNKNTDNKLFSEASTKLKNNTNGQSIHRNHSMLAYKTNKAKGRLTDEAKGRLTDEAKGRLPDEARSGSDDKNHNSRLICKANKAKSRLIDKVEGRSNDIDCSRLTDKASSRSNDKGHSRLVVEAAKAKSRLADEAERRSNNKGKSRLTDKADKANGRLSETVDGGSGDNHHSRLTDKSNNTLFQNGRGASLVPCRRLTEVPEKQNNRCSTKTDNTVTTMATLLQSSNVTKTCSSVITKQTEHCSLVTLKNMSAKSYGLVTPKNCKDEKPISSFTFSSQKNSQTEKPNSVTPKYYRDEKFCKCCVPVNSRNKTLGHCGKHSPSKIPRPVEEPTRPHLSEISQLRDVIPESWAHAMQPFLELLKMSGKEMTCRKSTDSPHDKIDQQMPSKIPRPYSLL